MLDAEVVEVSEGTTGRPRVSSCGDKAATLRREFQLSKENWSDAVVGVVWRMGESGRRQ